MDRIISTLPAVPDGDLMLCEEWGVAYQTDMSHRVAVPYFEKCAGYVGSDVSARLNQGRVRFVNRHVGPECEVLDVGVGSGEFISWRPRTFGLDVDPQAVAWLRDHGLYCDDLSQFTAFTFWDVLEHVEEPSAYLSRMRPESWMFCAIPIFNDLRHIRESRHYRPGEHLYYWTSAGFKWWIGKHGWRVVEVSDHETRAGRESILSFACLREVGW